nr:immunoglobulin light chain junction region [Macaca mulatta]
CMQALQTPHSC